MEMSQRKKCKTGNKDSLVSEAQCVVPEGEMDLVFDIVIRSLECPKLLRTCRLVCKGWNVAASAALRKHYVVSLEEDAKWRYGSAKETYEFDRFVEFMALIPPKANLPCPFQRISLKFRTLKESNFWNLARKLLDNQDFRITELEFDCCHFDKKSTKFIEKILTSVQATLTSLTLKISQTRDKISKTGDEIPHPNQIQLVNLKKMRIEYDDPMNYFPIIRNYLRKFVENILHNSKLKELILEIGGFEFVMELLSVKNMDTVNSLQIGTVFLYCKDQCDQIYDYFRKNPLRNLKGLAMSVDDINLDPCPILSLLSESLEFLSLAIRAMLTFSFDLFPVCPNLRELKLRGPYVSFSGRFLSEKFPSLKKLLLRMDELPATDSIQPHFGVEYLDVSVRPTEHNSETCSYCKTRKDMDENFPTLTCYCPESERLCNSAGTLPAIIKSFPNVKALALNDWFDFSYIFEALPSRDELQQFPFENIFKSIFPLSNFLELETLDISRVNVMLPQVIRYNLASVQKLKHLRIDAHNYENDTGHYDDKLVKVTRECLSHLKEVQIEECRASRNDEEEETLSRVLHPLIVTSCCPCGICERYLCKCPDCNHFGDLEFTLKFYEK